MGNKTTIRALPIKSIRRDGATQGRAAVNPEVTVSYAELMNEGVDFPPVRVWFDQEYYWLSDGFQRIAAAERIGMMEFPAEIRHGLLLDAQWDCLSANGAHGARRTREDIETIISRAISHPNARLLSTNQLAKHLSLPESTVRRWRNRLSSPLGEDAVRTARRRGKEYLIKTQRIGAARPSLISKKSIGALRRDLKIMRTRGSSQTGRIVAIIGNWVTNGTSAENCLQALEGVVCEIVSTANSGSS